MKCKLFRFAIANIMARVRQFRSETAADPYWSKVVQIAIILIFSSWRRRVRLIRKVWLVELLTIGRRLTSSQHVREYCYIRPVPHDGFRGTREISSLFVECLGGPFTVVGEGLDIVR